MAITAGTDRPEKIIHVPYIYSIFYAKLKTAYTAYTISQITHKKKVGSDIGMHALRHCHPNCPHR